jgi:hypothetical protein
MTWNKLCGCYDPQGWHRLLHMAQAVWLLQFAGPTHVALHGTCCWVAKSNGFPLAAWRGTWSMVAIVCRFTQFASHGTCCIVAKSCRIRTGCRTWNMLYGCHDMHSWHRLHVMEQAVWLSWPAGFTQIAWHGTGYMVAITSRIHTSCLTWRRLYGCHDPQVTHRLHDMEQAVW